MNPKAVIASAVPASAGNTDSALDSTKGGASYDDISHGLLLGLEYRF